MSETYSIEDCLKYDTTTYSGGSSINLVNLNYTLPDTDVIVECDSKIEATSNMNLIVRLGTNGNNFVWFGLAASANYKLQVYENSTYKQQLQSNSTQTVNTWTTLSATVENGKVKFKDLTQTYTTSFNLEKLLAVAMQKSSIRNIKIKPL